MPAGAAGSPKQHTLTVILKGGFLVSAYNVSVSAKYILTGRGKTKNAHINMMMDVNVAAVMTFSFLQGKDEAVKGVCQSMLKRQPEYSTWRLASKTIASYRPNALINSKNEGEAVQLRVFRSTKLTSGAHTSFVAEVAHLASK
jgi:hypothetical protein